MSGRVASPPGTDELARIYDDHFELVWKTLARCGVREDDLRDTAQEVFVVVHRRLGDRTGASTVTTWLYGICLRVAAAYRRRAHRRHEESVASVPEVAYAGATPENEVEARQAAAVLASILDEVPLEQRTVFVMFEVDDMSCQEIADALGAPLGTVFTRLRAARAAVAQAVARRSAVEARTSGVGRR